MKSAFRTVAGLLSVLLLLASCSAAPMNSSAPSIQHSPSGKPAASTSVATATMVDTISPIEETDTPEPTEIPTPTPIPLPTTNITDGLPDPLLWEPSLELPPELYPIVDGSTANIPLGVYVRSLITRQTLEESKQATYFTTTGPSYLALANGTVDILIVYEAPDEVKEQLDFMDAKLVIKPIGVDALVFLTNKRNPVKNLTSKQIIGIYTGKIKKWNQVGGEKINIIPYQRVSDSGSQALMLKLVMKGTKLMSAPSTLMLEGMNDLVDAVASYDNTNNALGYSVYYYVRNMYQVPGIKLLAVNGVSPNNKTIASGQYPYVNPFYAVIRKDEPTDSPTYQLFDWLTGPEGKRAITEAGYVAVK